MRSVLSPEECNSLAAIHEADEWFRSRIMMAHRGFGYAKYKYFARSLPNVVTSLRVALYPRLSGVANRWNETVAPGVRYPRHLFGKCVEYTTPAAIRKHAVNAV